MHLTFYARTIVAWAIIGTALLFFRVSRAILVRFYGPKPLNTA